MNKKTITKVVDEISLYDLETDILKAAEYLKEKCSYYVQQGYFNINLNVDYDEDSYFSVVGSRLETDVEYKKRLASSAKRKKSILKAKENKESAERKLYEKLKKKYEE